MFFLLLVYFQIGFVVSQVPSSLRFVQVWFRHGERMPTHYLSFPGQPPLSFDFAEIAYPGELTNRGMRQEYEKGKMLRKIYGNHFGAIYRPNEVIVKTGKDNRTSVSAQAAMAGFYPPESSQRWTSLNWLPVAQHQDEPVDWVSTGVIDSCPVMADSFVQSTEFKNVLTAITEKDPQLVQLLRNRTDKPIENAKDLNLAIDSLKIRYILNDTRFPVPNWAEGLQDRIYATHFDVHNAVLDIQNATVGAFHNDYVLSLFEQYLNQEYLKGAFISGHDTNVMAIWKSFSLAPIQNEMPDFGAHVAIELHEDQGQHIIKFWLSMSFEQKPVEVYSEYCGKPCTLEALQRITQDRRLDKGGFIEKCKGVGNIAQATPTITGSMILLVAVLILLTIIFGCTTCFYRKQLNDLKDPERTRLLG